MPSGTHLDSWDDVPNYCLDATSELPLSGMSHVINISGGSGQYTAGRYLCIQSTVPFNLGTQGTHGVWRLVNANGDTTGLAASARGCSYTFTIGRTDGDGTFGGNLISQPGGATQGFCFDPDSPILASMVGKTISISGGTGFTAGSYGIQNYFAGGSINSIPQPDFVAIVSLDAAGFPRTFPAASELANGAAWALVSGTDLPTVTPNTGFTGAVNVAFIGDSRTGGNDTITTELTAAFPNASSITVTNRGVTGSHAEDWAQGQTNYTGSVTAINLAGSTVVNIEIGANPSTSTSAWRTAIQSLVTGLRSDCPTVTKIVLQEIAYVVTGGGFDDTKVQAYNADRVNVTGCTIGTSESHAFFAADSCLLTDGVHQAPTAGRQSLSRLWLNNGLMEAIAPTSSPTVARRRAGSSRTGTRTAFFN